jgi:alpha-glucosidase (family GH31 glycosyl hydrolase)
MPLENGILSRNGFANIDDSNTMLFDGDWVAGRKEGRIDGYVFAHGADYAAAMRDYYTISGPPPLLPRWALGNWWSRFYAYSEAEYLDLMDKFAEQNAPLSIAVIDVDWHLINDERVQATGSSGWTG